MMCFSLWYTMYSNRYKQQLYISKNILRHTIENWILILISLQTFTREVRLVEVHLEVGNWPTWINTFHIAICGPLRDWHLSLDKFTLINSADYFQTLSKTKENSKGIQCLQCVTFKITKKPKITWNNLKVYY